MSRATSFVLGYHGCEKDVGLQVTRGERALNNSTAKYHWLGPGRYFWEDDPQRAFEWARDRPGKRALKEPFVIGAIIDPLPNWVRLHSIRLVKRAIVYHNRLCNRRM